MENENANKRLKGNVTIRTKADAAEQLDAYLAEHAHEHPKPLMADVSAEALKLFFDVKSGKIAIVAVIEADKLEQPTVLTPG
jgi:hypothetical protein